MDSQCELRVNFPVLSHLEVDLHGCPHVHLGLDCFPSIAINFAFVDSTEETMF